MNSLSSQTRKKCNTDVIVDVLSVMQRTLHSLTSYISFQ